VTLIAAAFALAKGSQLRDYEKAILLFIVFVALAGAKVLQDLQGRLRSLWEREGDEPYHPTDINWFLITIVFVVAMAVFYCVVRGPGIEREKCAVAPSAPGRTAEVSVYQGFLALSRRA
jgi:hypothetical protein